ncbi:MAG TPA: T9SS type A sorting domain-containing protein [Edaphocola sp.]|nr:T9SS type A sorting domain-containing protein [Edaphocola sp.]
MPNAGLYEVDFPNENAAYIVGDLGLMYKSSDEGINWSQIYDFGPFSTPSNLKFINADTGFININGNPHRTFDGGLSWTSIGVFQKIKIYQNNLFASYSSNDTTYISKSIDLGNSWTTLYQNYQVGNQPYILSFVDNSNAYFINPNELDRVYKTTDGFLSMDTIFITNGDLVLQDQFDFKDLQNGYQYGSWGSQSHPTRTWNTGTFYFPLDLDGFGVLPVLDLSFNTSNLYASSLYGKIFFSSNNGQNWIEQQTPINSPINSISFCNDSKGIAIASNAVLYTNNGGVVGVTDINRLEKLINIYPNPIVDLLNIQNNSNHTIRFTIYNALGALIFDKTFQNEINTIDLSSYSKGVFFYYITSKDQTIKTGKIIKP